MVIVVLSLLGGRNRHLLSPYYVPGLVLDTQSHFITTLRRGPCSHFSEEDTGVLVCLSSPFCCLRSTELLVLLGAPEQKPWESLKKQLQEFAMRPQRQPGGISLSPVGEGQ